MATRASTGGRLLSTTQRNLLTGLAFASPWIVGFIAFILYPAVASLYYSFHDFNLFQPPEWVGLDNYTTLLTRDDDFWLALHNSAYITVIGIPLQLLFAFICALLLNTKVKGHSFWRTIYFLPSIMPAVASTMLWIWVLNPELGLLNFGLGQLGLPQPNWLRDPDFAKPSIILLSIWGVGSTTIIYLAGLQGIPQELHEAAEIDGANAWRRLLSITIPLVSPVTMFNLITGVIWSLQYFTQAYIISGGAATGAPQGSLLFYGVLIYANAFAYLKMGYAAALAWLLFLITIAATVIMLRAGQRWTHYQ